MYSPRDFDTVIAARNCSASDLRLKPRLSVCDPSGFRYLTRYRLPAAVSYAVIVATVSGQVDVHAGVSLRALGGFRGECHRQLGVRGPQLVARLQLLPERRQLERTGNVRR